MGRKAAVNGLKMPPVKWPSAQSLDSARFLLRGILIQSAHLLFPPGTKNNSIENLEMKFLLSKALSPPVCLCLIMCLRRLAFELDVCLYVSVSRMG